MFNIITFLLTVTFSFVVLALGQLFFTTWCWLLLVPVLVTLSLSWKKSENQIFFWFNIFLIVVLCTILYGYSFILDFDGTNLIPFL